MKRTLFLIIVCLSFAAYTWAQVKPEAGRLRIDMSFVGNDQQQEVYLKDMQWDKTADIPSAQFIPPFDYGEYQIAVMDSVSHALLYKLGFSSLFFEWRTTDLAKVSDRVFDQSVFVPVFAVPVLIVVSEKDKANGDYKEMAQWSLNPKKEIIPIQSRSPYGAKKLIYNGDPSHKVDLVFLAEGYTEDEKVKFENDVERMVKALFECSPYAEHRTDFNVWLVESYSLESGTAIPKQGVYPNTTFSSSFNSLGIERYLMINNQSQVMRALAGVPSDAVYVLVNSKEYGGGGIYNFYGMSASDCRVSEKVFIHELGHSFAGLADEYFESTTTYNEFYSQTAEPWEPNITNFVHFEKKWQDMIAEGTPVPTPEDQKDKVAVGAYEGAAYVSKGMFRPSFDCRMRSNNTFNFCPVCKRSIERMIRFYLQ